MMDRNQLAKQRRQEAHRKSVIEGIKQDIDMVEFEMEKEYELYQKEKKQSKERYQSVVGETEETTSTSCVASG